MKSIISFLFCFICVAHSQTPTENYPQAAVLDAASKIKLYWKFNDTYITFEVHGQTTGWVGVGISPNGGMANSDIYVGWVKNGVASITDRHGANSNTFPPIDAEQNVKLIQGSESNGWTMIKFQRKIIACGGSDDITITTDTTKLIWALGATDPTGNDIIAMDYHGSGAEDRGTKSLLILEGASTGNGAPSGETYLNFTLVNEAFNMPAVDTYYNCRLFEIPPIPLKHHLVQIEPIVQAGNEANVHHILIYQCDIDVLQNVGSLNTNAQCNTANMPPDFQNCSLIVHAWAIGGGTFYYPAHTGYPLGTPDAPKYVVMETHYDNPTLRSDIVDNSGLRFVYTPQLRQYDAGIMEVGHLVHPYGHLIPPNVNDYLTYGECTSDCLQAGIEYINRTDINVFGAFLHSHLLGQALTLRHFRNGSELPHLARDLNYDFNYQESKLFQQEVKVEAGDSMQLICNYKTEGVRTNFTIGGLGTQQEMCLSYVFYYPKIPVVRCETFPWTVGLYNYLGFTNVSYIGGENVAYGSLDDLLVLEPPTYAGQTVADALYSMTWDQARGINMSETVRDMLRIHFCDATVTLPNLQLYGQPPQIANPYVPPVPICNEVTTQTTTTTTTGGTRSNFVFNIFYTLISISLVFLATSK